MNCDKEYRYEVRDVLIVKVDTETGEEVLNKDNSVKYFRPKDMGLYAYADFDDNEVEEQASKDFAITTTTTTKEKQSCM